jgi:hypothetical protein
MLVAGDAFKYEKTHAVVSKHRNNCPKVHTLVLTKYELKRKF